jgi:hypothetical protein
MRTIDEPPVLRRVPMVSERDLDAIGAYELDVILHLDVGRPPRRLAGMTRHGVWIFGHGRRGAGTGHPPGFWEVLRGDPVTHVSLTRLAGRSDRAEVLRRAAFRTHGWSYIRNLDAMHRAIADWPARLSAIHRRGNLRPTGGINDPADAARRPPGSRHVVGLALLAVLRIIKMQIRSVFSVDQWHVGVIEAPIHSLLEPGEPPVHWLPRPGPNRFLADPFGVPRDDRLTIVMEEFDHRANRGRVVSVQRDGDGRVSPPVSVMEPPSHISYPFLVEWDGDVYCVPYLMPEGEERSAVDLYRAVHFPGGWVRVGTLIEGFPAQDPTLFRHDDWWWLFCSRRVPASTELHGWFAKELAGPWRPHPGNPLKIDIRSSRPAGTPFLHDGSLYRPSQDESRTYGGGIVLNRVLRLSPTEFEEEPVTVLGPDWTSPYDDGVHTISAAGDVTLIDAKRRAFVWPSFRRQLRVRLRRAASLVTRRPRTRSSSVLSR